MVLPAELGTAVAVIVALRPFDRVAVPFSWLARSDRLWGLESRLMVAAVMTSPTPSPSDPPAVTLVRLSVRPSRPGAERPPVTVARRLRPVTRSPTSCGAPLAEEDATDETAAGIQRPPSSTPKKTTLRHHRARLPRINNAP
jgi:hypothetical protein